MCRVGEHILSNPVGGDAMLPRFRERYSDPSSSLPRVCRTVHANTSRFSNYQLLPMMLRDVSHVDVSTTLFGHRLEFPVLVAPTAMQCMAHADGE